MPPKELRLLPEERPMPPNVVRLPVERGALPKVGDKSQKVGIPGRPPSLKNPPPGCRFAARCPHATDKCRKDVPEFREIKPGRFAACHYLTPEVN